ncbi:uncharacterized protein LOC110634408 [Hevea brasiliensis]|nr:uncharacterized protein LOC110634408 [Hevea brasiliensis]
MSHFSSCSNLMMKFISIFIILLHLSMANGYKNIIKPNYELFSRKELARLAGYGEDKLSTVLITGTVLCKACLHGETLLRTWPVSGALVTSNCDMKAKRRRTNSAKVVTDEYGEFQIDLPSHLHAIPNLDRICSVKVLRMSKNSACWPAFTRKHKSLTLSSARNGIRNYTAGNITLLHLRSRPLLACTNREISVS